MKKCGFVFLLSIALLLPGVLESAWSAPLSSFTTMVETEVQTLDADGITHSSATLHGNLAGMGYEEQMDVRFRYGTSSVTWHNETDTETMTTAGEFSHGIDGLYAGTTYYFQAVALWDEEKSTGTVKSFVTYDLPSPELISPPDTYWATSTVKFTWQEIDATGLEGYELQISTDSFDTLYFSSVTANTDIMVENLGQTTYFWKVNAKDNAGNYSDWSSTWTVRIDTTPPDAPVLVSPEDTEWATSTVKFQWDAPETTGPSGLEAYEFQLSTDSFDTLYLSSVTANTRIILENLKQTTYFWKVNAKDNAGNYSLWSSTWAVRIDTTPPSVPDLVSPYDKFYSPSDTVEFQWSEADDNLSGMDHYRIEVSTDIDFTEIAGSSDTVSTSAQIESLSDNVYWWRVWARDLAGNFSGWSSTRTFTVDTTTPVITGQHLRPSGEKERFETYGGVEASTGDTKVEIYYDDIDEDNPGQTKFSLRLDTAGVTGTVSSRYGDEYTDTPDAQEWTLPALGGGHKIFISIKHTDRAGNYAIKRSTYYVRPHTPPAPLLSTGTLTEGTTTLYVMPLSDTDEYPGLGHSIYCVTDNNYVQKGGTLSVSEVFQSTGTWGNIKVTGLTANKEYEFWVRSRNFHTELATSSFSPGTSTVTLSVPPSFDTLSSEQSTGTAYGDSAFTFYADGGFGEGSVEYYRVAWDTHSTYGEWTGDETKWEIHGSTEMAAGFPSDSWYLHLKGYNSADVAHETFSYGPMWYSTMVPVVIMEWPDPQKEWYTKIISSFSGTVDRQGVLLKEDSPYDYNLNNEGWKQFDNEIGTEPDRDDWLLSELFDLGEGTHTLKIRVTNEADLTGTSSSYKIWIDTSPPVPVEESAITFEDIGISSMTVAGGEFYDATQGDVYYQFKKGEDEFKWQVNNSTLVTGLAANTSFTFRYRAKDGLDNTSEWSPDLTTATLSVPPSWDTVSCDRETGEWSSSSTFTFTAEYGFGAGSVEYYRVEWSTQPSHTWTGEEEKWEVHDSTEMVAGFPSDSWHLHLKGYNRNHVPNGTFSFGPFYFSDLFPVITLDWPEHNTWYGKVISSYTGTITDRSPGYQGIDPESLQYSYDGTAWHNADSEAAEKISDEEWSWTDRDVIPDTGETPEEGINMWVRVTDNTGLQGISEMYTIRVETTPPAAPDLLTWDGGIEGDGIFYSSTTWITALWSPSDAKSGLDDYYLQVWEGDNYIFDDWTDSAGVLKTLTEENGVENDKTYFFRVRAKNMVDLTGPWSDVVPYGIYVDTVPPPTPGLESPDDGETCEKYSPEFKWTSVSDPSGVKYVIQVSTDDSFQQVSYEWGEDEDIRDAEFRTPEEIDRGRYFWRVRAVDGALNRGIWSSTRSFISNRIPSLEWAGTEGFEEAGVNPRAGTESSTFTYSVKYRHRDEVEADNLSLFVWSYGDEDPNEYDMEEESRGTDKDGWYVIYKSTCHFSFSSDENPVYRFKGWDGLSYAGGIPVSTAAGPTIGFPITFTDHSPAEEQSGITVEVSIKASVSEDVNLDTGTVRYIIYHGTEKKSEGSDAAVKVNEDGTEAVFSVSTDTFKEGDDNFVRWKCDDNSEKTWYSSMYRVRIKENVPPAVRIIQPANKGYSTLSPVIEAVITDENGIDPGSVEIEVLSPDGSTVLHIEDGAGIFDSSKGLLKYNWQQEPLEHNTSYSLSVSAADTGYGEYSHRGKAEVTFTARDEPIADLVSYPNPFDPDRQKSTIRYVLAEEARVTVNIYNTANSLVKTLVRKVPRSKGQNEDKWDGRNFAGDALSGGIYFVEVIAEGSRESRIYQTIAIHRY